MHIFKSINDDIWLKINIRVWSCILLQKNIVCINFLILSYTSKKEKEHSEGTSLNTLNNPGFMHILNKRDTWRVK